MIITLVYKWHKYHRQKNVTNQYTTAPLGACSILFWYSRHYIPASLTLYIRNWKIIFHHHHLLICNILLYQEPSSCAVTSQYFEDLYAIVNVCQAIISKPKIFNFQVYVNDFIYVFFTNFTYLKANFHSHNIHIQFNLYDFAF